MQFLDTAARLSPVYDQLQQLTARWATVGDMPVALDFGNPESERSKAEHLGLCDVSWRTTATLKGAGVAEFLASKNFPVPQEVLEVNAIEQGGIVARTGAREFFLEDGIVASAVPQLLSQINGAENCTPVLRQDASFLISGTLAPKVLMQTCGYDFRRPHGRIVMTRVAGVSSWILHRFIEGINVFQLWADGSFGVYLWKELHEIVSELGGSIVGSSVFFPQLASYSLPFAKAPK